MTRLYGIGPVTTWTLGIILAELSFIEPETFWESTHLKALESKISASSISPLAKNLLFMCLNKDPNKRPNTKEILEYLQLNLRYIENNKTGISESKRFCAKWAGNSKAKIWFLKRG
jgi:serine/threonine protein kinase